MFNGLTGDLEKDAKEAVGNWKQWSDFGWHDKPEDADRWFIFYTHNRDSGLLEESNASVIEKELTKEEYENDVRGEDHNHWACGWVAGFSVRVYDEQGQITPAFKKVCEITKRLNDYPVLDDEDYSQREYDATLENIRFEGKGLVNNEMPDTWAMSVFTWLWDNNQRAVESSDDRGGCPNEEEIKEALIGLGLRATYECGLCLCPIEEEDLTGDVDENGEPICEDCASV